MSRILDARGKRVVWSYTLLNIYERVCPHQAFRRYVKRDLPYKETVAMKFGNDVHKAFEARIAVGRPLPESIKSWEPFAKPFDGTGAVAEQQLAIDEQGNPCGFWDEQAFFRGKIDVAIVNCCQAAIFDFKTGSSRYESSFELETNAMLLRARFPQLEEITGRYIWLKENRLGEPHDLSDTELTLSVVRDTVDAIVASHASGDWPKRPGALCSWCDVSDCEHNRKKE